MADIIDINVFQSVNSISFEVEPITNIVNINKITVSGGEGGIQDLQAVTDVGATTTKNITANAFIKIGATGTNLLLDNGTTIPTTSIVSSTNLTPTQTATNFTINSDTGTDATIPLGNGTSAGATINDYTTAEKNKLAGIATGAEVNVNADWNATSGDAQILNKPTIPTTVTQTSQLTNNGADGVNPFITALDIPIYGQSATLVREVRNTTGATLTKGTVVYINGANGNKPTVAKALATTDALSARTFGLLQTSLANNTNGYVVVMGDLTGLDTSAFTEGVQLYLSGVTAGTYTATKILAPTHLVYVGKVTRSHPTQGQIEVAIQNGYELEEIHDVAISGLANEDFLQYELSTDLWKNKPLTDTLIKSKLGITTLSGSNTGDNATNTQYSGLAASKQDTLQNTVNIKSINGTSILGSGNLTVSAVVDDLDYLLATSFRTLYNY